MKGNAELLLEEVRLCHQTAHVAADTETPSLAPTESAPLVSAFEKKYGIKVETIGT